MLQDDNARNRRIGISMVCCTTLLFAVLDASAKWLVQDLPVGERQRLEILKALFRGARILILDEPTAVLTPQETEALFVTLRQLRAQGTTVLLTTQYLEEADQLADSISVIDDGKVIAKGTSDELKASIGGQRVELSLVSADDTAAARAVLARHGSGEPTVSTDGRALTVNAADAPTALQAILGELGVQGIRLFDAGMRRPTLDDVFLTLTGHMATEEDSTDSETAGKKKTKATR